jgi:hypothetical protein
MTGETRKIIVNLDIGKPSKTHTKKNHPKLVPIIPPNHLKNELINKIKHLKNKPSTNVESSKDDFTDEFCKSIEYLNSIKKKQNDIASKKSNGSNTSNTSNVPNLIDSTPNSIKTKTTAHTIKNNAHKYVQMDLPDELMETPRMQNNPNIVESIYSPTFVSQPQHSLQQPSVQQSVSYKIDKEVPYGCLKNGMKQGYRNWKINQTRKNTSFANSNLNANVETIESQIQTPIIRNFEPEKMTSHDNIQLSINEIDNDNDYHDANVNADIYSPQPLQFFQNNIQEPSKEVEQIPQKDFIKKTTIKKHTLGKSTKYRKVGVLIKNKTTRKHILNAYKELKKTPMPDIKKYLKKQGLVKVGTTAPTDVLRQTYESSIMAGEITNQNNDILFHNFVNDKEA